MELGKLVNVDGQVPPPLELLNIIIGQWVSQAVCSCARLGIADALKDGPLSSAKIAEIIGGKEDGAYRLMRALSSVGVLREDDSKRFELTEMGQFLRSDIPGSMNGFARFVGNQSHVSVWNSIDNSILTGQPGFEAVFAKTAFEFAQDNATFNKDFNDAMTAASHGDSEAILNAYDFSGIETLVDVGGGHGYLLARVLSAYPDMQGVLFDMSHVVDGAKVLLESHEVLNRTEIVAGSFLENIPEADAYMMKYIIHDWDDDNAIAILENCRKAARPGSRFLIFDMIVPEAGQPHFAKIADIEMLMVTPKGRERTANEFEALIKAAGLRLERITPTAGHLSIIESRV